MASKDWTCSPCSFVYEAGWTPRWVGAKVMALSAPFRSALIPRWCPPNWIAHEPVSDGSPKKAR